jgi:hypothetical protein
MQDLHLRSPPSEGGGLATGLIPVVWAVGFEPTISGFQGRHSGLTELRPEGAHTAKRTRCPELGNSGTAQRCGHRKWSGWLDSNQPSPASQTGAFAAKLRPVAHTNGIESSCNR